MTRSLLAVALATATLVIAKATAAAEVVVEALDTVEVNAPHPDLAGDATCASEGRISASDLALTPQYRPGQLLETVPGLIVTSHSGEGKANQFLMRGYNLDHGTDLETVVDAMPVNQPTHAHGQGYIDLNFVIPELADDIAYTKGPYYAPVGDFGAAGSVRMRIRDTLAPQLSLGLGEAGFRRFFAGGSTGVGDGPGRLLGAVELQHYDGPFAVPDDARRENLVLRWSRGDGTDGASITAMLYHQIWTNTTDIPLRAIADGLVADRFGSLDPSDGGHAQRNSVSGQRHLPWAGGHLDLSAYLTSNQLHLVNNFTHDLIDPVQGDQEDQFEYRVAEGAAADWRRSCDAGGRENDCRIGLVLRHDSAHVGRRPSEHQMPLPLAQVESAVQADPASFLNDDRVSILAASAWAQVTTHWSPAWRSILGLRLDDQRGRDDDALAWLHQGAGYSNGGTVHQSLLQPKASLAWQVSDRLETYLSAGEGFHSADIRGVNQDRFPGLGLPATPLLAQQWGEELGLRTTPASGMTLTMAAFHLWQQSETILDPDAGQDTAGPPSRRFGFEMSLRQQINRHLDWAANLTLSHTRFTSPLDDGTGHVGDLVANAPVATGNLAWTLKDLGAWSGGLNFRYLGRFPLSSGPCNDAAARRDFAGAASSCLDAPTARGQVDGRGFGQWNLDVRYRFDTHGSVVLGLYNLLNVQAAASQFWYVDRLRNEVAAYPAGRADVHAHPLEPRMLRITGIWSL